jgi:hypothetical protein
MFDPAKDCLPAARAFRALALAAAVLAGCAAEAPVTQPAAQAPAVTPEQAAGARKAEQAKLGEEARAVLAQAETDVQRARARRALWLKAWQDLLAARKAVAQSDYENAIVLAKSASDLAQLGLEQLAYPAVK